jgi:thiamine pyrophosphate-dependent acetolactate synthase large subunit-like protein
MASDARTFVREARRVLGGGVLAMESLERRRDANAADRLAYETARVVDLAPWDGPGVHPGRVVAALERLLPPDTIVTTDAGHFGGWAARGLWMRRPGTYLGPTAGAMGYGLPAAIAASLASPGRPVVALVGDGGLGMTVAELETAVREGARPVVLVFDNARYGTIRDHQDRRGLAPVATDLGPVDWTAIAEGFGAAGVRVESDEAFEPAFRAALASRRPTVLHLVVDRRWVSVDRFDERQQEVESEPGPAMEAAEGAAATLEPVSEPEAVAGPEAEVQPEPEAVAGPEAELQPEPEAVAGPEAELQPEPEAETPEPEPAGLPGAEAPPPSAEVAEAPSEA